MQLEVLRKISYKFTWNFWVEFTKYRETFYTVLMKFFKTFFKISANFCHNLRKALPKD